MVSLNPNPLKGFFLNPMGMSLPIIGSFPTATDTATAAAAPPSTILSSDDQAKKVRKPYTITKSRESWTEPEHDKFLEALQLFDRDWKKIEAFVGSKTVIQIRSHAQKFFLKVQKSGTNEHLPPPRPKRKAAHPYPQKASKNAPVPLQVTASFQASPALPETQYLQRVDSTSLIMNPVTSAAVSCWTDSSMQTVSLTNVPKDNIKSAKKLMAHNCCSSSESTPSPRPASEMTDQGKHGPSMRVLPDFARVYSFIGSVFDPNASGHLQKLKKMDPIDVETVVLLMTNLFINLSSPDFEDHRRLLSCYEIDAEKKDNPGTRDKILHDNKSEKAA